MQALLGKRKSVMFFCAKCNEHCSKRAELLLHRSLCSKSTHRYKVDEESDKVS